MFMRKNIAIVSGDFPVIEQFEQYELVRNVFVENSAIIKAGFSDKILTEIVYLFEVNSEIDLDIFINQSKLILDKIKDSIRKQCQIRFSFR